MRVRKYSNRDIAAMIDIWNEVAAEGETFLEESSLDARSGEDFFAEKIYCGIGLDFAGNIHGLYTLKAEDDTFLTASFVVKKSSRGQKTCSDLAADCIKVAKDKGYKTLKIEGIPECNETARHLCEKFGFVKTDEVKDGFTKADKTTVSLIRYEKDLNE